MRSVLSRMSCAYLKKTRTRCCTGTSRQVLKASAAYDAAAFICVSERQANGMPFAAQPPPP